MLCYTQWCGVANSKSAPDCWKLCIVCQALQDLGWTCRIYSTTQQRFFKLNMITHAGVTAFLIGTTGIVCEALRTISPENLSALHAKYGLFQTANQAPRLTKKVVSTEVKKSSSSSANEPPLPKRRRRSAVASNSMKNKKEPSKYVGKSTDSKNIEIELPDISKLLENKKGLSGILEADVFQSYNLNFGTDSNIAARIFISLGRGYVKNSFHIQDDLSFQNDIISLFIILAGNFHLYYQKKPLFFSPVMKPASSRAHQLCLLLVKEEQRRKGCHVLLGFFV